MNLQSLEFLLLIFVGALGTFFIGQKSREGAKCFLLLVNIVFYGVGPNLTFLASSTLLVWLCLIGLKSNHINTRKVILLVGMIGQLGPLIWMNYADLFSGGRIIPGSPPLGLSFFAFQQIWILKETYLEEWTDEISLKDLFLVNFFFPTITSGPILRPNSLLPQLKSKNAFQALEQDVVAGLFAIGCGTCKKMILANQFATIVDNGMALEHHATVTTILVAVSCTLRLYFDFSGYCDVAVGCARLFGFRLPANFDSPLRATSLTQFWSRWHITLTTFLRECLYIPLGGNRKGKIRTYLNLMIIFLISGLWHGAAWTFLFWGGLHGLGMVTERMGLNKLSKWRPLGWVSTFAFVSLAFVYFFAPSLSVGHNIITGLFLPNGGWTEVAVLFHGIFPSEMQSLEILFSQWSNQLYLLGGFGLYLVGMVVALWPRNTTKLMESVKPLQGLIIGALMAYSILSFTTVVTFVYANF